MQPAVVHWIAMSCSTDWLQPAFAKHTRRASKHVHLLAPMLSQEEKSAAHCMAAGVSRHVPPAAAQPFSIHTSASAGSQEHTATYQLVRSMQQCKPRRRRQRWHESSWERQRKRMAVETRHESGKKRTHKSVTKLPRPRHGSRVEPPSVSTRRHAPPLVNVHNRRRRGRARQFGEWQKHGQPCIPCRSQRHRIIGDSWENACVKRCLCYHML